MLGPLVPLWECWRRRLLHPFRYCSFALLERVRDALVLFRDDLARLEVARLPHLMGVLVGSQGRARSDFGAVYGRHEWLDVTHKIRNRDDVGSLRFAGAALRLRQGLFDGGLPILHEIK